MKEGTIIKIVKLYIDEDFIKSKLKEEYKDCHVIFRNSHIDNDNILNFECIITEDNMPNNDVRRERII